MSKYAHAIWSGNVKFETRDLRNGLRLLRIKCGHPPFVSSRQDLAEFSDEAARHLEVWSLQNPGKELTGCPEYMLCLFCKKRVAS